MSNVERADGRIEQLGLADFLSGKADKECVEIGSLTRSTAQQSNSVRANKPLAPMLQQYVEVKQRYPDHLLLFQVGDFYEVFFDDARTVSDELNIRLTSRDKDQENPVPMCGVPIHAIDNYLPKLLQGGFSCIIVSQVEDAKAKKGMVRREITRIVTPGVRFEGDGLDEKRFNYLAAACSSGTGAVAVSCIDISTGRLRVFEGESQDELVELLRRVAPVELLLPSTLFGQTLDKRSPWLKELQAVASELGTKVVFRAFEQTSRSFLVARLADVLPVRAEFEELGAMGPSAISSITAVLAYVEEVSFDSKLVLSEFLVDEASQSVVLDAATRRNLELTESRIDGNRKNSLLAHIDYTKTAMGSRLLLDWVSSPSNRLEEILRRHDAVEELCSKPELVSELRTLFVQVRDVDRLVSRITGNRVAPRDLRTLLDSIDVFPRVKTLLEACSSTLLSSVAERFDSLEDIAQKLSTALVEDPPLRLTEGGIFREGFSEEVDRLRGIRDQGHLWLAELEAKERVRSGISNLKIRYNNVFGYYIEVTKTQASKVPDDYERRQTLTNAERYSMPALKDYESSILSAKSRQIELERELFIELRGWMHERSSRIQLSARDVSYLDVLCAFSHLAVQHNFVRPHFHDGGEIRIVGGRHPVVEQVVGPHRFVPNETHLDNKSRRFAILTGPNMGGKSTYLRQVGLIQILAQAGSFVPAKRAELGVVDRVFTRIGAADDLSRGDSTFMVEMREAATIVRKATPRSLVLIDEIGRGTATADGMAIASAIAEWLLESVACRTIFATHFHELTRIAEVRDGAFCLAVGVVERDGEIAFTHCIEERIADRSYGIEVARLAGLPEGLLRRAEALLSEAQASKPRESISLLRSDPAVEVVPNGPENPQVQLLLERLRMMQPVSMTPLQALTEIFELKQIISEL